MERYETEKRLPPLKEVLDLLGAGNLEYFESSPNRDGKKYRIVPLLGPDGPTVTPLHRIIAASSLGEWVDRRYDVDHINHDPSDNRAENLEIVKPSENRARRRQRLDASNAVNPNKVRKRRSSKARKLEAQTARTKEAVDEYVAQREKYIVSPQTSQRVTSHQNLPGPVQPARPNEKSMQIARDAFAAKHAHRRSQ